MPRPAHVGEYRRKELTELVAPSLNESDRAVVARRFVRLHRQLRLRAREAHVVANIRRRSAFRSGHREPDRALVVVAAREPLKCASLQQAFVELFAKRNSCRYRRLREKE